MDFSTPLQFLNQLLTKIPFLTLGSEYEKYLQYWPIFLIGFFFALIVTPIIGNIALKNDITYKPQAKRQGKEHDNPQKAMHEGIIPGLGGIAIILPAILAMLMFFELDSFTIPIILGLSILFIGAVLDDIFNLNAKIQFAYQILAATVIAFSLIDLTNISLLPNWLLDLNIFQWQFSFFGLQQSFVFPGDLILIVWLVLCTNAYKWIGGSPGIIETNSLVIYSLIFIIAIRYGSVFASTISILIVGALFAFLIFALPPPKIFSGSSGRTTYGFLICVLAFVADAKMATTVMLLILPLIDFAFVVIRRYIAYKPKNLLDILRINDTTHLHHQLLKMNFSQMQVVLIETGATLLLSSIAILTTGAFRFFAVIFSVSVGIIIVVVANLRASKQSDTEEKKESPESRYSY